MPDEFGHPSETFLDDFLTLSDTARLVLLVAVKAALHKLLCITSAQLHHPEMPLLLYMQMR